VISATQAAALTSAELNTLDSADMAALTATAVGALSSAAVSGLTTEAIVALSTAQAAQLKAAQLSSLSSAQLQALETADLAAVAPSSIGGIATAKFSVLTNDQIVGLTSAQVSSLTSAQVNALSGAQIAVIETADVRALAGSTLLAVDVTGAEPKLLGSLEVPGFSDRLYPLTDRLLLGVGHDTASWNGTDFTTGVRLSLIDVSEPTTPIERASRTIGERGTRSAADGSPHGLMLRPVGGRLRIALPVAVHEGQADPYATDLPDALRVRAFTRLAAFRFEIDPGAPALVERPSVAAPDAAAFGTGPYRMRAEPAGAFEW
jgi:hypothetical protein